MAASVTPDQRAFMTGLTTPTRARLVWAAALRSVEDFRECLKHVEDLGCRLT